MWNLFGNGARRVLLVLPFYRSTAERRIFDGRWLGRVGERVSRGNLEGRRLCMCGMGEKRLEGLEGCV